jgi:glycosyltransferase involved in cell wall biosynthesis
VRRAAIVSPDPANRAGGVERVCTLLGSVLERQGWDVNIIGPEHRLTRLQFRLGLGYPLLSWSATKTARAQHDLDLIVTNGFLGVGCPRRIPRIHLYHGTMVAATKAQSDGMPVQERLRRIVSAGLTETLAGGGATRLVCVSETVADEVRHFYRLRPDAVIPNGVDTNIFAPRDMYGARDRLGLARDGRYALFVGRLEHGKGSDLMVSAAVRAGYELLIAGSTGTTGARHLGILEPDALADAYAASDCVLFPSRYEACSLVVLEALACGRPLLATRVGWMRTLLRAVPAYDVLCIEPHIEDIATRLSTLAEIESDALVSAARTFVLENNSLERWSERWQQLIQEMDLKQPRAPVDSLSDNDREEASGG